MREDYYVLGGKKDASDQGRWRAPGRQNTAVKGVRKQGAFEYLEGQKKQGLQRIPMEETCHKHASPTHM